MKNILLLLLFTLLGSTAHAQSGGLSVIYESEPGLRLGALLDSATVGFRHRADFDLDGTPDLTLLRLDDQGDPLEMLTLDVATGDTLLNILQAEIEAVMGTPAFRFLGFFTFEPGGARQAVFRSRNALGIIAILVGKTGGADPFVVPAARFALLDLTGDGAVEIIVQNSQTGTVQVLGLDTGTATESGIAAALAPLLESYPNPFHDRATVAYDVPEPGPVTITIYDLRGRRVRTLVDQTLPAGAHRATWDGRDAAGQPVASGTYFYRLRVGDAVTSRTTIRIR